EIDDLDELVLRFVDASDIVEGHLCIRLLVVAARLRLAHPHQGTAEAAGLLRATEQPHVEPYDQERRTETEQKSHPWIALLNRFRADLDTVVDQELLKPGVDEGG